MGYDTPNYEKQQDLQRQKRFLLEERGDPIIKMENLVKDFEGNNIKELKK
jgi:hypothetical protein